MALLQTSTTGVSPDGTIKVHGTADSPDFAAYRIRIGEGIAPTAWEIDETFLSPVRDSLLYLFNVSTYAESAAFRVELEVDDTNGQTAVDGCLLPND